MTDLRTENIGYDPNLDEGVQSDLFFNGPAEFLVREIARDLRDTEEFATLFGVSVDCYRRMDYGMRQLPAARVYNESGTKEHESWFLDGEIKIDVILPAELRREETQQVQDTIAAALLQQFRRPAYFERMATRVPGLNELGKRFSYDKSLGFEWNETVVPLTQLTLNFRMDLRVWDSYLEQTNRTKDSPFKESIGDLRKLVGTIEALRDDLEKELETGINQRPGVPKEEG